VARSLLMRTLANLGLSLVLVVTLAWGGCVSCSQYFMFASSRAGCCHPSGHCGKVPTTPASKDCHIQPLALTKTDRTPGQPSLPTVAAAAVPVAAEQASVLPGRPLAFVPLQASPPDLCTLHSVFRI
jgi:hypothetical protein